MSTSCKALVTGGAGFMGSHVAEELVHIQRSAVACRNVGGKLRELRKIYGLAACILLVACQDKA